MMKYYNAAVWKIALMGVCAGLVASCAAPEPQGYLGEPSTSGVPLQVVGIDTTEGFELVRAFADEAGLVIVTTGSRSCPWVPSIAGINSPEMVVEVVVTRDGATECTADMSPTTFEFTVDHDLTDFTVDVEIVDP